jgi:hypothetical protein
MNDFFKNEEKEEEKELLKLMEKNMQEWNSEFDENLIDDSYKVNTNDPVVVRLSKSL